MSELFKRQSRIFDPIKNKKSVAIVGCGSLGSWTAILLAKLGFIDFDLYDYDYVEEHNIANQMFEPSQIGYAKSAALKQNIKAHSPIPKEVRIRVHEKLDNESTLDNDIIVATPDRVSVRKLAYELAQAGQFIADGRTGTESSTVFFVEKAKNPNEFYEKVAIGFEDGEAEEGDCQVQSIGYSCANVATLLVNGIIRYCRKEDYPKRIINEYATFWTDVEP